MPAGCQGGGFPGNSQAGVAEAGWRDRWCSEAGGGRGGEEEGRCLEAARHENLCNKPFGTWETLTFKGIRHGDSGAALGSSQGVSEPGRGWVLGEGLLTCLLPKEKPSYQGKETSKACSDLRGSLCLPRASTQDGICSLASLCPPAPCPPTL